MTELMLAPAQELASHSPPTALRDHARAGAHIHLLGVPRVLLDGTPVALRGHKAWAILAYLALHEGAVSRQYLASLLFAEAADPLAALRWNLSELRRALGTQVLRRESLEFSSVEAAFVDIHALTHGRSPDALAVPGLGRDLLEGLDFARCPAFEVWLLTERRRLQATAQAVLHEGALACLAGGAADQAAVLAGRLVALNPLDEKCHVLLVRCLAAAGDVTAAARQTAACRSLFARELGVEPSPALEAALRTVRPSSTARPAQGRAATLAQLEAGEAAVGAGIVETGLSCFRRAAADADRLGDPALRTRARVALGSALVHAARGRDEEGSTALHEALAIGRDATPVTAAAACRELGYVEFLRGAYDRARAWLDQAATLGRGDAAEQARIATVDGAILTDTAHYAASIDSLERAQSLADEVGDTRQSLYAATMRGRALLLHGDIDRAVALLDPAIRQAQVLWTALLPWPQAFRAEVDLLEGRVDQAAERFEQAFALGCLLSDPCWEGIAARGLGCVAAVRGETERAAEILEDAVRRCGRLPDAYQWGKAYALEALCRLAVRCEMPRASGWVDALMALAERTGMREFVVHAHLHMAALGSRSHAAAARVLAREIDSRALAARVMRD